MNFNLAPYSADTFRTFGFVVLRQFFDPNPLAAEIDRVMRDGLVSALSSGGEIRFEYVPMMTAGTRKHRHAWICAPSIPTRMPARRTAS